MAKFLYGLGLLIIGLLNEVTGYEYCAGFQWCSDGYYCCHNNTRCCSRLSAGAITGIVIGICAIVGTCIVVCIVCMRRRRSQPGVVVVQGQQAPGVVIATTGQPGYGQQGFVQQPPPYNQPAPYGQPAAFGQPVQYQQQAYFGQPPVAEPK